MPMHILVAAILVAVVSAAVRGAEPPANPPSKQARVTLRSAYFSPGVPLAESAHPFHAVNLDADVNEKGEGGGRLTLMRTPPNYDEYGDLVTGTETDLADRTRRTGRPPLVLDCTIEFVREGAVGRVNRPPTKRSIFRIKSPDLQTPIFFATTGPGLTSGRLLLHDPDGRVEYVVELSEIRPVKDGPPVPCHPGCFPAGTPVLVPGGTTPIERLRPGDAVTAIAPDGRAVAGRVEDVFSTRNHLVEVRTDRGTVLTTGEQPLCLTAGGFRRASDLKPGDTVWYWSRSPEQAPGARAHAVVRSVTPTDRHETVFNLILGDGAVFVANHFLALGKPPADAAPTVRP